LIVDGRHVLAPSVRVAMATAPGRIMLVSDAVAALGMPPGRYVLGAGEIIVRADEPPTRPDGTIAGAAGRLDDAIGLAVAAGAGLRAAVEAATRIPADALGRPDLGRLRPGAVADLVWLAPQGRRPVRARAVWRAGLLISGSTTTGSD
jgi:N-acetylglucosamine-6-phosphate deacetylase